LVYHQLLLCPSAGITNQMSIDELSPCEEETPASPAEDEHNQNGNLD
jgi:calcium/calmodulin-dependent 3',5'-cyclic nucleotide phosphodiesterase